MRVGTAAAIVAGLIALATTGCASTDSTQAGGGGQPTGGNGGTTTGPSLGGPASAPPAPNEAALAAAATCPTTLAVNPLTLDTAKPVPAGLQVSFVLRCKILTTGGNPTTLVAERSTSSPAKLVAALQAPSIPRAKVVCPMLAVQVPYFALVTAQGRSFVPKIPLDNCGKPQNSVLTALNLLQFTQITSKPIK